MHAYITWLDILQSTRLHFFPLTYYIIIVHSIEFHNEHFFPAVKGIRHIDPLPFFSFYLISASSAPPHQFFTAMGSLNCPQVKEI